MTAVSDAAAAILGLAPGPSRFPAVGVIRHIAVTRGAPETSTYGTGAITAVALVVTVDDVPYDCGWSGAFAAEIMSLSTTSLTDGAIFLGRQVKVEVIGGQPSVAYTVNRSTP